MVNWMFSGGRQGKVMRREQMKMMCFLVFGLLLIAMPAWGQALSPEEAEKRYQEALIEKAEVERRIQANKSSVLAQRATFALPQLQEFIVPITPISSLLGAMFGSLRRQEKQIDAYWVGRSADLDRENAQCVALSEDAAVNACLNNVRETEIRKSNAIALWSQQRVQQQYAQSAYMMQAIQNGVNQYQQAIQRNRPVTTNCRSYNFGYGSPINTDCTSY